MYSKSYKKFLYSNLICAPPCISGEPNKVQGHQNTVNSSKKLINGSPAFRPA